MISASILNFVLTQSCTQIKRLTKELYSLFFSVGVSSRWFSLLLQDGILEKLVTSVYRPNGFNWRQGWDLLSSTITIFNWKVTVKGSYQSFNHGIANLAPEFNFGRLKYHFSTVGIKKLTRLTNFNLYAIQMPRNNFLFTLSVKKPMT